MDARTCPLISGGEALDRVVPLLEAADEGFFDWNVAADEIRFNDRYYTMLGYEPGAFPATYGAWRDLLHPDDWSQVSSVVAKLFDGQRESYDIEFRIRNSRGRYQVLRARGRVLSRDGEGRPERIIGIHSDVTEHREAEERFFRLFRRSPAPLAVLDASTERFLLVNASFAAYFGRREDDFAGRTSDELGLWADRSERERLLALLLSGEEVDGEEILFRGADGGSRYGQVYAEWGEWKGEAAFFIVINDVTEIKRSEERLKMALEAGGDGLWDWEIDSGKVFFSGTWKAMFGFGPDEVEPSFAFWFERIHPEDRPHVEEVLKAHLDGGEDYSVEYRFRQKDGSWKWVLTRGRVVGRDGQGRPLRMVGTNIDIAERKAAEVERERLQGELIRAATTDKLTGIFNRQHMDDVLRKELALVQPEKDTLSLILFDLDRFKAVNDTYGHLVGDAVLIGTAQAVRGRLREGDTLCRWGGEEFLILALAGAKGALALAESLRDLLERTEHDEAGVVTASFGVAPYEEGLDADGWVRRADEALYGAKRSGRNRVVLWTPEAEGILDEKPGS